MLFSRKGNFELSTKTRTPLRVSYAIGDNTTAKVVILKKNTLRFTQPVDSPPPPQKQRSSAPTKMLNRSKSIPPATPSVTPRNKALSDWNGAGATPAGKRRSVSNNAKSRRDSSSSSSMATTSSSSGVDPLLRDGNVFYRTVLVQPGVEPEVSLTFVRPSDVVGSGPGFLEKGLTAIHGGGAGKEKARSSVEIRSSLDKRPSLVPPQPSSGSVGAECRSTSPGKDDQKDRHQTQVMCAYFIIQTLPRSRRLTLTIHVCPSVGHRR